VAEACLEWKKPQYATQYYGSANKGLGFYHINVAPRPGRFKHWTGFDNFGVFKVEEGELGEEEIVQTLKAQIDREWQWKLMRMDEYRYLVKFPPHIKVESKVLGEATYFYLKNDEVMASPRVWNGNIEPVGQLKDVWVQIKGVPPKWCDWVTIKEIASSLGKLGEVDWQTLFSSFFSIVRVRIFCKDPQMIPESRVMEMEDLLFMIHFKVENLDLADGAPPEDPEKEEEKGDEEDSDDDLLGDDPESLHGHGGKEEGSKGEDMFDKSGKGSCKEKTPNPKQNSGQKNSTVRRALFMMEGLSEQNQVGDVLRCPAMLVSCYGTE
jgi:hypothetical protein